MHYQHFIPNKCVHEKYTESIHTPQTNNVYTPQIMVYPFSDFLKRESDAERASIDERKSLVADGDSHGTESGHPSRDQIT